MTIIGIPVAEAQAEKAVVGLFRLHGWLVHVMREDIHVGTRGVPDLMVVSPHGLVVFVEMKRPATKKNPKGRVRKAQIAWLADRRRRGVLCLVADSADTFAEWPIVCWWGHQDARPAIARRCDEAMVGYPWWPGES